MKVAIKIQKATNETTLIDAENDALTLVKLCNHSNIVCFVGVCRHEVSMSLIIVTEYAKRGSLFDQIKCSKLTIHHKHNNTLYIYIFF